MKKVDAISYILLVIAGVFMVIFAVYKAVSDTTTAPVVSYVVDKRMNVKNITVTINDIEFNLYNGITSKEIPNSTGTRQVVKIVGDPVYGELNGDTNSRDAAIVLTSTTGGDEVHYYAVFAIASGTHYTASQAMYIGDRVEIQSVIVKHGNALYSYTENSTSTNIGEPQATSSPVKSILVHYNPRDGNLGELVKDFEGEADPSIMNLFMKEWVWVETELNDGRKITPQKQEAFSITFKEDGDINIKTDCNAMFGKYEVTGNQITFGAFGSTKMYCEDSQEQEFARTLSDISSFMFTGKGELILEIKMDSGVMVFR